METCQKCSRDFKDKRGLRLHRCSSSEKKQKQKEEATLETEQKTTNPVSLTSEERSIADRAQSQDIDWFTIREDELEDFSLAINPLDLQQAIPEAWLMQVEKQFAFRWCERTAQRIDELTKSVSPPLRWALVTRVTLPALSKYVDPSLGCIANLDQALLFKPWSHHERVNQAKQNMARDRADSAGLDALARQQSDDKVRMTTDPDQAKIGGRDEVTYEDTRSFDGDDDMGGLVVDE